MNSVSRPTNLFLTAYPKGWEGKSEIISALQAFETSLVLVGYRRFPHVLSSCASALETVLQVSGIGAKEKDGLKDLAKKASKASEAIRSFLGPDLENLEDFKEIRNQIVHRGFSPDDDSISVRQFLSVGLPFLELCLSEFHDYQLSLSLDPEVAQHLSIAHQVYESVSASGGGEVTHCLYSLGHLVRLRFSRANLTDWEDLLESDEQSGNRFLRLRRRREHFEHSAEMTWTLNCPVCKSPDCTVVSFSVPEARRGVLEPLSMSCVECGFNAGECEPGLCRSLLSEQLPSKRTEILSQYGLSA